MPAPRSGPSRSSDTLVLAGDVGGTKTNVGVFRVRGDRHEAVRTGHYANAERASGYFARARTVLIENGGHELLPDERIQELVAGFFASGRLPAGRLTFEPPRFQTLEEALLPPRRR